MSGGPQPPSLEEKLARLEELEETLRALQAGEVDALVVNGPRGPETYTLRSADEPYRVLVEQMGEGALMLGGDGSILYSNRSFAELVARAPEELAGRSLFDWLPAGARPSLTGLLEARRGRQRTFLCGSDGGDDIAVMISARPMAVEGIENGVCVVVTDLREHRRLERAEREIAAGRAAHAAKNRFLALLGHELRNPLGALRNAVDALRRSPDPDSLDLLGGIIDRQTALLGSLVDDLLDLSRIERDALEVELCSLDLADLLMEVVAECEKEADALGIALRTRAPARGAFVDGDPARLRQLLHTLISSAVRASDAGTGVGVGLEATPGELTIRVSHRGTGFSPEQVSRMFAPSAEGEERGYGLALFLAHGIAAAHGGDVEVEKRRDGSGSTSVLRLPRRAESGAAVEPAPTPRTATPVRMVLIDDHRDSADSLRLVLARAGHEVHVAYEGKRGIELACEKKAHVVVSDIGLPDLHGFEVARQLRRTLGKEVLLIALSGFADHETVRSARDAGFDLHLSKPVDLRSLRTLIGRTGRSRSSDSP